MSSFDGLVPSRFQALKPSKILFTHIPDESERVARDLLGRFTNLQQSSVDWLTAAAKDLQEAEAGALEATFRRPQGELAGRPEEYLLRALLSPRNRLVTRDGFAVNLIEWLDSPASKVNLYWRGLEEGTAKHVGQTLLGFFLGPGLSERFAPSSDRFGEDPRIGFRKDRGGGKGSKASQKAGRKANKSLTAGSEGNRVHLIRIERAISPRHYIEEGITEWQSSDSLDRHFRAAMDRAHLRYAKGE